MTDWSASSYKSAFCVRIGRRTRRLAPHCVLTLLFALGLVATACGSDDSSDATASLGTGDAGAGETPEPDETDTSEIPVTTLGPTTEPGTAEELTEMGGAPRATATIGEDTHVFSDGHCQISATYLDGSVSLGLTADDLTNATATHLTLDWVGNPPTGTAPPRSPGSARITMADGTRLEAAAIFGAEFEVSISGSTATVSTTFVDPEAGEVPVTIEAMC